MNLEAHPPHTNLRLIVSNLSSDSNNDAADHAKNSFLENEVDNQDKSSHLRLTRMLPNFLVIWLDSNMDELRNDYRKWIIEVERTVNTMKTFTDVDDCVDFLTEINDIKVFMIVSGPLDQCVVPLIEELVQLDSIYVLSSNRVVPETSATVVKKVKGVFHQIEDLCRSLERHIQQCERDWIPISILSETDSFNRSTNELDQSFMYTQLVKEILLEIKFDDQSKKSFTDFCRLQYSINNSMLQSIDFFDRDYASHSSIQWYSKATFIYSILNRALRTQDIDIIIKMGFFVQDLHREIERHFVEHSNNSTPLTVYRGQGMFKNEFEKLRKSGGGLLAFNSFLSTSSNRMVASAFAESSRDDLNLVGILFEMKINSAVSSTPFALLDRLSHFEGEEELLFSMHSIFRIGELKKIDDRLWQVELISTTDSDLQLKDVTDFIRKSTTEFTKGNPWYRLGLLMIKMGELNQAERLYKTLFDLQSMSTDDLSFYFYHLYHVGMLKHLKGDLIAAMSIFQTALQRCPPNLPEFAVIHQGIALVQYSLGNYLDALSFHKKSLEMFQKILPSDHQVLAITNNHIGMTYLQMGNPSTALSYMKKQVDILEKCFPSYYPELAMGYGHIGEAYRRIGNHSAAYSYLNKTLEIQEKYLPVNHFELANTYNNLGLVHNSMGDYQSALSCFQMTLQIRQNSLPSDHYELAKVYNNLGLVHFSMKDHFTALSFYQDAIKIYAKVAGSSSPDLATTYNNIGAVYDKMGDYSTALSYFEKTLEIEQKCFSPDHPTLAATYSSISSVHLSKRDYRATLSFLEKARLIRENTFPPNLSELAETYNNIGWVHKLMGDHSNALKFLGKALRILEKCLPPNHPSLVQTRVNIAAVHH